MIQWMLAIWSLVPLPFLNPARTSGSSQFTYCGSHGSHTVEAWLHISVLLFTFPLLTMPKPLTVWITTNWKIFKEMGIPDHLTCLLRNLKAGQEAAVRTGHEITDWFQIGKGVHQGCILSPCLFNLYWGYIMRDAALEESRLLGEISITSDMQMTPPL